MNDQYGDGICCAYGNGSYSLTNSSTSAVLASGGSFASSESTSFCIGGATNAQFSDASTVTSEGSYFDMYPNPVEDRLVIRYNSTKSVAYQILDLKGRMLVNGRVESESIDLSSLSTGVYMLKISDGTKTITRKVMKK